MRLRPLETVVPLVVEVAPVEPDEGTVVQVHVGCGPGRRRESVAESRNYVKEKGKRGVALTRPVPLLAPLPLLRLSPSTSLLGRVPQLPLRLDLAPPSSTTPCLDG